MGVLQRRMVSDIDFGAGAALRFKYRRMATLLQLENALMVSFTSSNTFADEENVRRGNKASFRGIVVPSCGIGIVSLKYQLLSGPGHEYEACHALVCSCDWRSLTNKLALVR